MLIPQELQLSHYFASRSLDVFITNLRKSLKDEPLIELKNIRGVGFVLLLS